VLYWKDLRVLLVDNGTSFLPQHPECLRGHETVIRAYDERFDAAGMDAVILSGGHALAVAGHDRAFAAELGLIRTLAVPLLGICLGFELIAHAFGARLEKLPAKERGLLAIETGDDPLFRGAAPGPVFESHRWAVRSLPPELTAIARSRDGIEAFRHVARPVWGVQFHPEVGGPKAVLENFLALAAA
jgi:para-aminobenzoate synthetase